MTEKMFWLYDVMRESMQLFRAGFHLKNGRWTLGRREFPSRQTAILHLNDLVIKRAIERILPR